MNEKSPEQEQKFKLSEEEILETIPRLKSMLVDRLEKAKRASKERPDDVVRASAYRRAALDLRCFTWCLELCGRMATAAKGLSEALSSLADEKKDDPGGQTN